MITARLPGNRLHLQHGPIDLILGADGAREAEFAAAARFETVLAELAEELPLLRQPVGPRPNGAIARAMHAACRPHSTVFVTPMAAVAGAVAQTVLAAMVAVGGITRCYVNNGGDIAVHLTPGASFRLAMAGLDGRDRGRITIRHADAVRGIATSGRGGRSHTLGIADQVTVLAPTAAMADVAATLIANAVDLPGHPAITRRPASDLSPDSDLGARPVVTHVGPLTHAEHDTALACGLATANEMQARGLITAAALFLGAMSRTTGAPDLITEKEPAHA